LEYKHYNLDSYNNWILKGGRMPNPWFSTNLVWDRDLSFEGLSAKYKINLHGSDSLLDMTEDNRTLFFGIGAFPLKEVELSSKDKWLFGAQVGTEFILDNQSVLTFGAAYYDFENVVGKRNAIDDDYYDFTAVDYAQKANSMMNIANDVGATEELYALAADFELVNLTFRADLMNFSPHRLTVVADYVRNIGYNTKKVSERVGEYAEERNVGYQLTFKYGWSDVSFRGNWRAELTYRYLERDAVIDAFTDSDFHLGGTDAKGYILGFDYGLIENTWFSLRYMSSDEIDGPTFGIDTVQVDINTKF
jgi:hypothetical protein